MAFPTITTLPTAPARTQAPDAFATTADTFVAALPGLVTEVNTAGAYIDTEIADLETFVNTTTITVGNSFQGNYAAGTTYALGDSVLYTDGKFYLSLQSSNTGNTPDTATAYWVEIAGEAIPDQTGNSGKFLTTDGISLSWGAAGGGFQSVQVFTASGTWTKPAGITKIKVTVVGGGGGGGGASGGVRAGMAGGGSSGASVKIIDVSAISSESVTVGSGGSGGTGANGTSGGTSSFGAHCSATGGGGGAGGSSSAGAGGAGGAGTSGNINIGGAQGSAVSTVRSFGGPGGSSIFGGEGGGGPDDSGGYSANGYGSGGGGSGGHFSTSRTGGNGKSGIIIIEEYA